MGQIERRKDRERGREIKRKAEREKGAEADGGREYVCERKKERA